MGVKVVGEEGVRSKGYKGNGEGKGEGKGNGEGKGAYIEEL